MSAAASALDDATSRTWHIKQCPLLKNLAPDEIAEISRLSNLVSYGSKRVVSFDASEVPYVWLVKRGHLKMNYTDASGRQVAVVLLNPGDIFGALATEGTRHYGEHCTALTPTCLCRIARNDFESLMAKYPGVSMQITRAAFGQVQKLQIRLAEIMMRPAEARLAHALLELSAIAGKDCAEGRRIELPVTHRDLAELIGTTREMVSYVMRKFRDLRLVESARQEIVVLDAGALAAARDSEE